MSQDSRAVRRRVYDSYVSETMALSRQYDESSYRRWSANTYRRVRDWLPADRSVRCLDVGCGHGNVLHMLACNGYHDIQGVDASSEQVALAQRVCSNVVRGDAFEYLVSRQGVFDVVLAFDVIEHFTRAECLEFLELVFGALRPGGCCILQTPNADSPWCSSVRYGDLTHETAFSPQSLQIALRLVGFRQCECRETRPVAHGPASAVRWLVWQVLRLGMRTWNIVETGSAGSGVLTRVFRARALRP